MCLWALFVCLVAATAIKEEVSCVNPQPGSSTSGESAITIKGIQEAFETPWVCSNYGPQSVKKTFPCIENIESGNALFTFPFGPIKCAGAPQKIAYLAEDHFRKMGKRDKIHVIYNTALPVIYSHSAYAETLLKICAKRNIEYNLLHNLVEVKPDSKEAVFDVITPEGKKVDTKTWNYSMLHVAPPCGPVEAMLNCKELTNDAGFVTVNKETLQHTNFPNIFAIGDCTDIPTAKTAAAVASQLGILKKNLTSAMSGKPLLAKYNGYTSCPILVSLDSAIFAEYDFDLKRVETFPFDQSQESKFLYHIKATFMPYLYWNLFLKGYWEGPSKLRKLLRLGFAK